MLADGLIVSCAAVSNGIAEGWGSKAAVAGTSFSNEAYRTSSTRLEGKVGCGFQARPFFHGCKTFALKPGFLPLVPNDLGQAFT